MAIKPTGYSAFVSPSDLNTYSQAYDIDDDRKSMPDIEGLTFDEDFPLNTVGATAESEKNPSSISQAQEKISPSLSFSDSIISLQISEDDKKSLPDIEGFTSDEDFPPGAVDIN